MNPKPFFACVQSCRPLPGSGPRARRRGRRQHPGAARRLVRELRLMKSCMTSDTKPDRIMVLNRIWYILGHAGVIASTVPWIMSALPFGLFKGGFKVSLGIVEWCISSSDTDFDHSEIASPRV